MTDLEKLFLAEACKFKILGEFVWVEEGYEDDYSGVILDICSSLDVEIEDEDLEEIIFLVKKRWGLHEEEDSFNYFD